MFSPLSNSVKSCQFVDNIKQVFVITTRVIVEDFPIEIPAAIAVFTVLADLSLTGFYYFQII